MLNANQRMRPARRNNRQGLLPPNAARLNEPDINSIFQRIASSRNAVENLSFDRVKFTTESMRLLIGKLGTCPKVRILSIANSAITKAEVFEAEVVRQINEKTQLVSVTLNNVNLLDRTCSALTTIVQESSQIHRLELPNNRITSEGAKYIASMLADSGIVHLNVRNNNLLAAGGELIGQVLASEPHCLKTLDIGSNQVGERCVAYLAEAMSKWRVLEAVHLDGSNVTMNGCEQLVAHIPNSSLTSLALGFNRLGDDSLDLFTQMLEEHSETLKLKRLYLHSNQFSSDGIIRFARALKGYHRLETLDLRTNVRINDSCFTALQEAVKCHPSMRKLNLGGCGMTGSKIKELEEYVRRLRCFHSEILVSMRAARQISRLGHRSQFSKLPIELLQQLSVTLG